MALIKNWDIKSFFNEIRSMISLNLFLRVCNMVITGDRVNKNYKITRLKQTVSAMISIG